MTKEYRQLRFQPPKGAADLLLIRHGETEAARPGVSFAMKDGQGDPALRPEGEAQAQRVAARLADEPIDAIYVTKLRRTHQTAAPLAERLGMTPVEHPDLHEIFLGDWDGGEYRIRAANRDPVFLRALEEGDYGVIPGAETTASLHARVKRGLFDIAATHPDQRVAVVVHGGVIGAALSLATSAHVWAFGGAANGSISRLVIHEDRMILRGFNDVSHLD